ncbi:MULTISPECIES: WXG100 family type VII secretion target [Brachybacterium]|uniref:WXG100 family type VII secretion target n=1 Tax=Brachybacterium TaxID=43668 RepID=UPI0006B6286C|nr:MULTISPECIES: hypothetical protein [Brachybacterium]GAP77649.1 hypothetical protein Y09_0465 [Brachybacterium sp. SW0106-09]
MAFQGMDPEQVRATAERMRSSGTLLAQQYDTLHGRILGSAEIWRGEDAERFRETWSSTVGPRWSRALERLQQLAETAEQDAEEQDVASAGEDDAGGGDSGGTGSGSSSVTMFDGDAGDVPVDFEVQDAWREMEPDEKKAVLQEMVDQEFERYGMDPVEITWFSGKPDPVTNLVTFGSWNEDDQVLRLNDFLLDQPDLMLTTVHEVRHAVQYEFIEQTEPEFWDFLPFVDSQADDYAAIEEQYGVTREEIEAWRENFSGDNYKSTDKGDTHEEYQSQPVEVDAREREDEFAGEELTMEQLKKYQEDAGVEVDE